MAHGGAEKILVIKLSALGDFVQALGPMAAIRRHHPKAHIKLMTTKPYEAFGKKCGYFDTVVCDTRPKFWDIAGWAALRDNLREPGYTRVYDLQNNDRTNFYFRLFPMAKRPEWVGTAIGASHSNLSASRTAGHELEGHIETLALAGIRNIQIDNLAWAQEDISGFKLQKPFILFVPGSAPQHPHKRWPAEKYAEIAKSLNDKNYQVVLLGTEAERDVTKKIAALCPDALDLTGLTNLLQIAVLAREALAAVGNDTGPMHMIAPTGCPTLALFSGKSHAVRHAPRGKNVRILQKDNIQDISSADVISALEKLAI